MINPSKVDLLKIKYRYRLLHNTFEVNDKKLKMRIINFSSNNGKYFFTFYFFFLKNKIGFIVIGFKLVGFIKIGFKFLNPYYILLKYNSINFLSES